MWTANKHMPAPNYPIPTFPRDSHVDSRLIATHWGESGTSGTRFGEIGGQTTSKVSRVDFSDCGESRGNVGIG